MVRISIINKNNQKNNVEKEFGQNVILSDCGIPEVPVDLKDVFLVDGPDALHGRLVLTHNGINGTVCDDLFTRDAAIIVCRMLGYR